MKVVFAFLFMFSANAFGCEDELSVDAKMHAMLDHTPREHQAIEITHLLNEAFSPMLRKMAAAGFALSEEQIVYDAYGLRPRHVGGTAVNPNASEGMNAMFEFNAWMFEQEFSYSRHNQKVIERLTRATEIFFARVGSDDVYNGDATIVGARALLRRHSFTETNMAKAMHVAFHTILQAASQLTADPVPGLSAQQVLEKIMSPREHKTSLMAVYALMLPPALIGPNGNYFYWHDPLVASGGGELSFSTEFKNYLRERREIFANKKRKREHEMGHGCPVAHCAPDAEQSSLQDVLDALMYVYRLVPE